VSASVSRARLIGRGLIFGIWEPMPRYLLIEESRRKDDTQILTEQGGGHLPKTENPNRTMPFFNFFCIFF